MPSPSALPALLLLTLPRDALSLPTGLAEDDSGSWSRPAGLSPLFPGSGPNLHFLAHSRSPGAAGQQEARHRAREGALAAQPDGLDGLRIFSGRRPRTNGHPADRPPVLGRGSLIDWQKATGMLQRSSMGML